MVSLPGYGHGHIPQVIPLGPARRAQWRYTAGIVVS
jgi:hypothetical protein